MQQIAPEGTLAVRFFMPSPALVPYISTYYLTEGTLAAGYEVEDWLHPEWANVRVLNHGVSSAGLDDGPMLPLPTAVLTGPTSTAQQFGMSGQIRTWGIGILPLGWLRLIGVPASGYVDRTINLADEPCCAQLAALPALVLDGPRNPAAEAQRIDAFLLDQLRQRPVHADESRTHAAHTALVDDQISTVGELAERLGMSARSLERLSLKAFGFPPKLLLRRQRFLRSLAQFMLDPSLTWIRTLDFHYVDQAHFVRDFRRFMKMSPRRYGMLDHPVLRAAAQGRTAAAGAAVQALHRP